MFQCMDDRERKKVTEIIKNRYLFCLWGKFNAIRKSHTSDAYTSRWDILCARMAGNRNPGIMTQSGRQSLAEKGAAFLRPIGSGARPFLRSRPARQSLGLRAGGLLRRGRAFSAQRSGKGRCSKKRLCRRGACAAPMPSLCKVVNAGSPAEPIWLPVFRQAQWTGRRQPFC